jgi:hypothetical protein
LREAALRFLSPTSIGSSCQTDALRAGHS